MSSQISVKSVEVPVGAEAPFAALFLADTLLTQCDARDNGRLSPIYINCQ